MNVSAKSGDLRQRENRIAYLKLRGLLAFAFDDFSGRTEESGDVLLVDILCVDHAIQILVRIQLSCSWGG